MKYLLSILLVFITLNLSAKIHNDTVINVNKEQNTTRFYIKPAITITNKHLWRGLPSGDAPCIEPSIKWGYKKLSLTTWSSYSFDNSYKEIDFILNYSWKFLSISLTDFYYPAPNTNIKFSNIKSGETEHILEGKTVITVSKKIPLKLTGSVIFAGNDIERKDSTNFKQLYSSYFEIAYPISIEKNKVQLEIGFTPAKSMYANTAKLYYYGICVSRDIKINDKFSLPTKYKIVYNSNKDAIYFSALITIR